MDSLFPPNLGCDPKIPLIHLLPGSYEPTHGENSSKYPPTNYPPTTRPRPRDVGSKQHQVVSREIPSFAVRASCGAFAHGVAKASQKHPKFNGDIFFEGKVKEKMVDVFLKKTRADSEQIVFFSNGFGWSRWGCFCVTMWRSESHQNHQVSWTHRWLPVKRMGRLSTWLAAKQIPAVHGLGEISTRAMWCAMASNYKIPWGKCKCLVKNDTCTCNLPIFTRV